MKSQGITHLFVCMHVYVCAVEPVKCGAIILLQMDMSVVQCKTTMCVIPSQSEERLLLLLCIVGLPRAVTVQSAVS